MSQHRPNRVFDGPLNVTVANDGTVKLFLPNGDSLALSAEAAALSSLALSRAIVRTGEGVTRRPRRQAAAVTGQVIPVDFTGQSPLA